MNDDQVDKMLDYFVNRGDQSVQRQAVGIRSGAHYFNQLNCMGRSEDLRCKTINQLRAKDYDPPRANILGMVTSQVMKLMAGCLSLGLNDWQALFPYNYVIFAWLAKTFWKCE